MLSVFFTLIVRPTEETSIGMDDSHAMKASNIPGVTWNFEVKIKDKNAPKISVRNGDRVILDKYQMLPSKGSAEKDHFYLRLSGLNLKQPTLIMINNPAEKGKENGVVIPGDGKTIFVSYENGKLRPQSGTGGIIKEQKTQSGLQLKNNIKDIKMLSPNKALEAFWKLLSVDQLEQEFYHYYTIKISASSDKQKQAQNAMDTIIALITKGTFPPPNKKEAFLNMVPTVKFDQLSADELKMEYIKYIYIEDKYILNDTEQKRVANAKIALAKLYYKKTGKILNNPSYDATKK